MKVGLLGGALVLLAIAFVAAVLVGSEPVSLSHALADPDSIDRTILFELRLPHVALAAIAGAGLSVVGAAFQALLRNPLAEPYVLGVSGGAALGATSAIAIGVGAAGVLGALVIPAAALAGGLAATILVYAVARRAREGSSGASILLAGVMVNSIASSLITFMKTLVSPSRALELLRWLIGYIDLPTGIGLAVVTFYVVAGSAVLLFDAARMNLLALGDESAESLGVDVRALELRVFLASSAIVGAIVSVTGLIGFIGLVVPHALRRLTGPDHRTLLPLALAAGASALVACDALARVSLRWLGSAPPVGAITAIIGGPAFLYLLARSRRA